MGRSKWKLDYPVEVNAWWLVQRWGRPLSVGVGGALTALLSVASAVQECLLHLRTAGRDMLANVDAQYPLLAALVKLVTGRRHCSPDSGGTKVRCGAFTGSGLPSGH